MINVYLNPSSLQANVAEARRHPEGPFADAGFAVERLLASGVDPNDVCLAMRQAVYEATFSTLYALGDPGVDDDDVFMLFEELLTSDPSGLEGRTSSVKP
ncbi:MAG: hypothetical protein KDI75_04150 [Xanthomonadales bacterium]|nr:hypothetical protein [Xanthomonadales bacterium]